MGFFRRLTGSKAAAQSDRLQFRTDMACGDELARAWMARLARGEWTPFVAFLDAQTDIHRRDFYLRVAARSFTGRPEWIELWPQVQPNSGLAFLLRGMQSIEWAWEARGGKRAKDTPAEAFETFHPRLAGARNDLNHAAQLLPGDAMPWAELIVVGMGLGASVPELLGIYGRIRALDPWHPEAAPSMVKALAAKWRGSDEEMFEFVRNVTVRAPDGSPVHECVPMAHYEVFLDRQTRAYFDGDGIHDEIVAAAARSIDLRPGDRDPWLLRSRSMFAITYWLAHDLDRLRVELLELHDVVTGPWLNLDDPISFWRAARIEAGIDLGAPA